MNIEALCAAPPEALPHSPCQMPLGCPIVSSAPGRPKSVELQDTAPSPTPTRAAEHNATTPVCGPAGHRAFARADPRRGTPRHDAGPKTSRPCRQSALKMSRIPSLGLPHQQWVSNVQRALHAAMKKRSRKYRRVRSGQPCASWGSRLPTSSLNDRGFGLALAVQRSGKVRGSAGRDHRVLQKKTPPKNFDGQDKHLLAPVLNHILHVLVLHVSTDVPLGLPHQQRASNVQRALGMTIFGAGN